jgi:hypothetical protein
LEHERAAAPATVVHRLILDVPAGPSGCRVRNSDSGADDDLGDRVIEIGDAFLADERDAMAGLAVPESYRAVLVHKEADMFEGLATRDKDPRKSLHVEEVPTPELGPGEAIVAVMASSVNYNTVWTSIFEPVSTFGLLKRYGRLSDLTKRHDLRYHCRSRSGEGGPSTVDAVPSPTTRRLP